MSAPDVERIPPEVIVIPPMRAPTRRVAIIFAWLSVGMLLLACILFFVIRDPKAGRIVGGVFASIAAVYGIVAAVLVPQARKQERVRRNAQEAFNKEHASNPAARAIADTVADP